MVIENKTLIEIAKRNMKDIVPLYYDMKKAKPTILNAENIYEGMIKAFVTGNIGPYSNNITKIFNCGKVGKEQLNVIKMLCMENNFCIDAAKTLYMPTRPEDKDRVIKKYTNNQVPYFFIYAKDKKENQVAPINDSTMNRILNAIPSPKIKFSKSISKFDYKVLMSDPEIEIDKKGYEIIGIYDYWNKRQNYIYNFIDEEHKNQEDMYVYQQIRERIIQESQCDIDIIVDTLVKFFYTMRNTSTKKMLWACFGEEIVNNIKNNIKDLGSICVICGKRYIKSSNRQLCCCHKCSNVLKRERDRRLEKKHTIDKISK